MIASAERPVFLTAEWRKLAMANYAVDPALLHDFLPHGTVLDLFNDTCYVSLVGFRFTNTRLKGLRVPFLTDFEEVNLRFYVRHRTVEGWNRGVIFIREFVPKPALTFVARTLYKEPYRTLPMDHLWETNEKTVRVRYRWKLGTWHSIDLVASAEPKDIDANSEEEFITEHFWGYTRLSATRTAEYAVEHPRWQIYPVESATIAVDFGSLYGERFGFLSGCAPRSVLLAEGSSIIVRAGARLN